MREIQISLNLEIGSLNNLKGNAVIYWNVKPTASEHNTQVKILAINFVISVFPLEDNLVTATFPPVGFKDRDEFMLYIKQANCDLVFAGDISIKSEIDFLKNLPDNEYHALNQIINEYLEFYREKMDNIVLNLSLKEKLYLLKKLVETYRHGMNRKKSFIQYPVTKKRIRKIIVDLKKHFNPFDLELFNETIFVSGKTADKLTELYLEKFIAVHYEDYERASLLNADIEKYQEKLSRSKKD